MSHLTSRRRFLQVATLTSVSGVLLACQRTISPPPTTAPVPPPTAAPAAKTQPTEAQASWEQEWRATIAAAKTEGKLSISTSTGVGYRAWIKEFENTFPGIEVEHQQTTGSNEFLLKYLEERKAGLYLWDLYEGTSTNALGQLRPAGAIDPIKPALINRPDVMDDKYWRGGWDDGWQDVEQRWGMTHTASLSSLVGINTQMVREGEIANAQDLLNPKWKGQIMMTSFTSGSVWGPMNSVRHFYGDEMVKRVLVDQEPVVIRSNEQIHEFLVRGRYPIAGTATTAVLQKWVDEGVADHVKLLDIPGWTFLIQYCVWLCNRAPHPNAAKLFINWNLTREGSEAYASNVGGASRRADVSSGDPIAYPKPGQTYTTTGKEASFEEVNKTRALVDELAKVRGL